MRPNSPCNLRLSIARQVVEGTLNVGHQMAGGERRDPAGIEKASLSPPPKKEKRSPRRGERKAINSKTRNG